MKIQAWAAVLLLIGTGSSLHLRGDSDRVPYAQPLDQLPMSITGLTATEIPLDDHVLELLGKGVFLNRIYAPTPDSAASPHDNMPVGLFIGYFPTQRTGQAIHSPQNCLPGAGWTFDTSGVTTFTDASGKPYRVGEYLISNGKSRQEVLYWYRSHGRSVANDYMAKLYTLLDSIRYNRTDAALVRVITPLREGETQQEGHVRAVGFAQQLTPLLAPYIPD